MTRIIERSSAYPGGVMAVQIRHTSRFASVDGNCPQTTWAVVPVDNVLGGAFIPVGGSLELAWEPDGGSAPRDDAGDQARDQGPKMEPPWL